MRPALESDMARAVPAAHLPTITGPVFVKDWLLFAVEQTGQLEKANSRIEGLTKIMSICVRQPMDQSLQSSRSLKL